MNFFKPFIKILCVTAFFFTACQQKPVSVESSTVKDNLSLENIQNSILTAGEKKKLFSSYLNEMHEQIFLVKFASEAELNSWINVLMQGGSLEGVYHGLILSNKYRVVEKKLPPANVQSLRFFSEEYALAEAGKEKSDADVEKLAKELATKVSKASVFTLKRELAEKYLSVLEEKKADVDALARWYAMTIVRWNKLGINFGLIQRNNQDQSFHEEWAKNNAYGVIQWELLNRAHRIFNYYSGLIK